MKNFKLKNNEVNACIYQAGMEDGFNFYFIDGKFIKYLTKAEMENGYPKAVKKPVIETKYGMIEILGSDYIIIDGNGDKLVMDSIIFNELFEIK